MLSKNSVSSTHNATLEIWWHLIHRKMVALKKIAFMGAIFFHWLLIIFKYGHFGISFMVVVPSVAAQQPFCRQNFQILLLALQRILSSARKSQIFKSIWSCISRDYFKFGCGYLLSIVGCIFVPKIFAPGGPTPILEGGPCRPPPMTYKGFNTPWWLGLT